MTKYALLIDYKYCTGCHSCEIACRQEKHIESQEEWGIKFAEFGPVKMDDKWYWNYVPVPSALCDLCVDRIRRRQEACLRAPLPGPVHGGGCRRRPGKAHG